MSGVKLQRTLDQWRNCDPKMMVNAQSPAAIQFAIADAKHDIAALAHENDTLRTANQRLEGEVANYRELLSAWRRMFDGGIATGALGVLRGQTDAALRGSGGE